VISRRRGIAQRQPPHGDTVIRCKDTQRRPREVKSARSPFRVSPSLSSARASPWQRRSDSPSPRNPPVPPSSFRLPGEDRERRTSGATRAHPITAGPRRFPDTGRSDKRRFYGRPLARRIRALCSAVADSAAGCDPPTRKRAARERRTEIRGGLETDRQKEKRKREEERERAGR